MSNHENIGRDFDDIIIVSGATQVMDLTTKVLCNEGDTVICEEPSFIGSLNCFRSYGCKLKGVPVEADGMNVELLEHLVDAGAAAVAEHGLEAEELEHHDVVEHGETSDSPPLTRLMDFVWRFRAGDTARFNRRSAAGRARSPGNASRQPCGLLP